MTSREKYKWLQQSRTLLIDAYWPPLNPKLELDIDKLIRTAQNVNANAIRFGTIGKYALIQNDFVPLHPELGNRDLLTEMTEAAKGTGIKIIAYVSVGHGLPRSLLLKERPQWGLLMDDGNIQSGVRHFGGELVAPVCTFGKYHDDILNFIKQIVNNYDIRGLYLDGPYYNWNMGTQEAICQCDKCKQIFLDETGLKLPTNKDFKNLPIYEVFVNWVGGRLYELFRDIIAIAKDTKDLPVMFNAIAAAARPEVWERKMLKISDGFLLEAELNGLRGLGIGDYYGKIIWRYTQNHTAWPRCVTSFAEQKNKHSGYETLVWGGAPIISYGGRLCLDDSTRKPVTELFNFMKKNAALLADLHEYKFIGIISEQRISSFTELAPQSLAGSYKLFQSAGLQTGIVTIEALCDFDRLQQYPVLFLSGDVKINEAEAKCLREYVKNGGNLIASGKASFCNDIFLLEDVFNVSRKELPAELASLCFWDGLWDVYLQWNGSKKLLPVKEITWIKAGENTQSLAEIVMGTNSTYLAEAIIKNCFGKGTCWYINFPIERLYNELEDPEFIEVIDRLIEKAQSPYKVTCEHRIYSSLKEKENLKVLYLCNPDVKARTFTVTIELKVNAVPDSVCSLTNGRNIKYDAENGGIIIKEYSFNDFECIAITFRSRSKSQ